MVAAGINGMTSGFGAGLDSGLDSDFDSGFGSGLNSGLFFLTIFLATGFSDLRLGGLAGAGLATAATRSSWVFCNCDCKIFSETLIAC